MPSSLEVRGLARAFGHFWALRQIDFALERGDALAIFGPNGAGKTTLLRIVAGLLKADKGSVTIDGAPLKRGDAAQRRRVGMISHASMLYDGLTATENLEFYARLYDLPDARGVAARALEAVGLAHRAGSPAGTMSRGMVQRLTIARALLHDPELVLLDEPFTGLDQAAAAALRDQLMRLRAERRTVVLVTHNMDEGLELATHVAIQVAGRFVHLDRRTGDAQSWRERYAEATGGPRG